MTGAQLTASRIFRGCFWISIAVCTWLALTPSPPRMLVFKLGDVVLHAAAFGFLSVSLLLAYQHRRYWQVFLWMVAYGVLIEFVQSFEAERTAELKDLGVDVAGTSVGLFVGKYVVAPIRKAVEGIVSKAGFD